MNDISIATFNCRGLRNRVKRRSIFRHIHTEYPHSIVCLQETHSEPQHEQIWQNEFGGTMLFSHAPSAFQAGVAILFPFKFLGKVEKVTSDQEGRIVTATVTINNRRFVFIGAYGPAGTAQNNKIKFLNDLHDQLIDIQEPNVIIAGDLNISLTALDSSYQFHQTRSTTKLADLIDQFSLIDTYREQNPARRQYRYMA